MSEHFYSIPTWNEGSSASAEFQGSNDSQGGFNWPSSNAHQQRPTILLAVLGITGVGKTSFINVATGGCRVSQNSLEPSTTEIKEHQPIPLASSDVILVDTPGFDNAETPDISVLDQFVQFLKKIAQRGIYLSGILYLHRITDIRMSGTATKNIQLLRILCGDHFLRRVTLVTTMWDSVQSRVGKNRERELQDTYWAEILDRHNAIYDRYDGSREAAERIIRRYLDDSLFSESGAIKSSIEQQVVDNDKPLRETDVGRFALEKLREKVRQFEQRLQEKREAKREMDYDESLEFEAAQILEEIRKGEVELESYKKLLADDRGSANTSDTRDSGRKGRQTHKTKNHARSVDMSSTWAEPEDSHEADPSSHRGENVQGNSDEVNQSYWEWDGNHRRYFHREADGSITWAEG